MRGIAVSSSRASRLTRSLGIFRSSRLVRLKYFIRSGEQLGIIERQAPAEAAPFFTQLLQTPFAEVMCKIFRLNAKNDIRAILEDEVPRDLQCDPFYEHWLADITHIVNHFCEAIGDIDAVTFWIGSDRGCSRYHVDQVPYRLLVTYAGKGTEWLPNEAVDREAFFKELPPRHFIKDKSAIQFLKAWDVAIFRGGPEGVIHRTPQAALSEPSILLRLDLPSFWDRLEAEDNDLSDSDLDTGSDFDSDSDLDSDSDASMSPS